MVDFILPFFCNVPVALGFPNSNPSFVFILTRCHHTFFEMESTDTCVVFVVALALLEEALFHRLSPRPCSMCLCN